MKILMTTTGLGIGGAETHIIELVKALKAKGFDICIASAGGVYVPEIEAAGIRHYTVPLNKRSIKNMFKSYCLLSKIIKTERPDIVHAHARLPAWICGLIHKTRHFHFVTTAHFTFDVGHGLKYFTNWGEKTIAVSDDLKKYLHENYGTSYDQISITINGINTDFFSPDVSGERIVQEFSLDPTKPIVCHVSRLDEHTSIIADYLIDLAPDLDQVIPGIQIVITGGGTCFDQLNEKAHRINSEIGHTTIIMTGPRTDINQIIVNSTVFVGVSRAALEALATAKPVILAGAQGYMGLFTKNDLDKAILTNLCCRDCAAPDRQELRDCIVKCICNLTDEQRALLGNWGRQVVFDHYSVSRMADDYIEVYKSFDKKVYHIVMSGYYGFGNSGDEAILCAIHNNLLMESDDISITVLSSNPKNTKTRYGYHAVNRFNIISILRAIKRCDLLIFGGGSLLQDYTSTRSLLYYLSIIRIAKHYGKKVMVYANGIGPVSKPKNRARVQRTLSTVDVITLRDQDSADELRQIGIDRNDIQVTADPVFTLNSISPEATHNLLLQNGVPVTEPFICVSIRKWREITEFCKKFAAYLDDISNRYHYNIVFLVMQSPQDYEISLHVQSMMQNKLRTYILNKQYLSNELLGVVGKAEFVVSMRLHSLIFAARMCTPLIGIVYDPKVEGYLKMLNMPSVGTIQNFDVDCALKITDDLVQNRSHYAQSLRTASEELCTAAHANEQFVIHLLEDE
jgi:polysaccharide pyruvyl transferase CsaB